MDSDVFRKGTPLTFLYYTGIIALGIFLADMATMLVKGLIGHYLNVRAKKAYAKYIQAMQEQALQKAIPGVPLGAGFTTGEDNGPRSN